MICIQHKEQVRPWGGGCLCCSISCCLRASSLRIMSALFLPLAAAQGLLLAVAFLNLGTQTVGLAGEPPKGFPVYPDKCHEFSVTDSTRKSAFNKPASPGKSGRHPIAILASRTALFRAENLSPDFLPLTSSLNRLNSARPAWVPLQSLSASAGGQAGVHAPPRQKQSYLPTDCQTAGASAITLYVCSGAKLAQPMWAAKQATS